jgi:NTE family protein
MKRVGLALGGGGARGLCMIEFCKALDELGVKPNIISGTSIGAIIGAFYAAGFSGREMEKRLSDLSLLKIPHLVDFKLFSATALIKGRRISAFFRSTLGCDSFADLSIPLIISATDYWNRSQVVFDQGPLIPAIRASMSLPVIFEPVEYKNTLLIDGGISNPLPHDLIRDKCDYLIAIDVCGKVRLHSRHNPRIFDSIMNTFETMQCSIIAEKLIKSRVECYIQPMLENVGILDFYREKEIRKSVQQDVIAFEKKLQAELL